MFHDLGEVLLLLGRTFRALPHTVRQGRKVLEQLHEIGNASLLMACLLSLFIGGVLALQTGPVLAERGLHNFIGQIVGLSMCRELAPVMMAVLIAGRIGSAMAAELGSMQVYQEIDALRTLSIHPVHYLVLPRLVAISVALPTLVVFSILVGWVGGALVSVTNYQISISLHGYVKSLGNGVDVMDVINGLLKSLGFAVAIGAIACHQGLSTTGGPRGIGRSVTKAVVNSIVMILLLDYVFTRLLMHLD